MHLVRVKRLRSSQVQVDDLRVEVLDGFDCCVDLLGRDVLGALGEVGPNLDIALHCPQLPLLHP